MTTVNARGYVHTLDFRLIEKLAQQNCELGVAGAERGFALALCIKAGNWDLVGNTPRTS